MRRQIDVYTVYVIAMFNRIFDTSTSTWSEFNASSSSSLLPLRGALHVSLYFIRSIAPVQNMGVLLKLLLQTVTKSYQLYS